MTRKRFFSADYAEARSRWRNVCAAAGVRTVEHVLPHATGPQGETLAVDVVRLGNAHAPKLLFSWCGIHGAEVYPGSAAQLQFIAEGSWCGLPADTAVLLVHGLNPWGWSRHVQSNEDGVDLNRNFVDHAQPPAASPLLARVASLVATAEMTQAALARAVDGFFALQAELGEQRFIDLIAGGQTAQIAALDYGGVAPAWSNRLLRQLAAEHLRGVEKCAVLDWHTGLGEYGETFEMCLSAPGSVGWQRTAAWWGLETVERGHESWSADGDTPAPTYAGLAETALFEAAPQAMFAGGTIEFGTWPLPTILGATIVDRWLVLHASRHGWGPESVSWRERMREWFAPRDPAWEAAALAHGRRLFERTLGGLVAW